MLVLTHETGHRSLKLTSDDFRSRMDLILKRERCERLRRVVHLKYQSDLFGVLEGTASRVNESRDLPDYFDRMVAMALVGDHVRDRSNGGEDFR